MSGSNPEAQKLKDEGNALFGKKRWREAAAKYSQALKNDPSNSVLFCNRSACMLHLKKYAEAATDASHATELDPTYAKAWSRLAIAKQEQNLWPDAVRMWNKAVAAFPPDTTLSAADKGQKEQYEKSSHEAHTVMLQKQNEALNRPVIPEASLNELQGNLPWERAAAMVPELMHQRNITSSAWCIRGAYLEFKEGMDKMHEQHGHSITEGNREGVFITGRSGVLQDLSNGCIRDRRVMRLIPTNFIQVYNQQVDIEVQSRRAWVEGDAETILGKAQDRLRSETWDTVRISLAVTVRRLIMNGFLSNTATKDPGATVSLFDTAVSILEGGRKIWENVPDDSRGAIFTKSFIRGLKALRLDAYTAAHFNNTRKYPLRHLLQSALQLAAEVLDDPYPPQDRHRIHPGHELSFWIYPIAEATATLALCEKQLAMNRKEPDESQESYLRAAELYVKAANLYPEDEEYRCIFLHAALDCFWEANAPLSVTLPVAVALKEMVPKMERIWEHSTYAERGNRNKNIALVRDFEREAQAGLREGRWTLEEPVKPLSD